MNKEQLLHIELIFIIEQRRIEMYVSESSSFYAVIHAVTEMLELQPIQDTVVYEQESMMQCDLDVSLHNLHVMNHMKFLVY